MISCENLKVAPGWSCTGSDESHVWNHLHKEDPKKFNCAHCEGEYRRDMRGYHDIINVGLGKNAENTKELFAFQKKVNTAVNFCKTGGTC